MSSLLESVTTRLENLKRVERRANPFRVDQKSDFSSAYGLFKFLIGGFVLLPVRLVLILIMLGLQGSWNALISIGIDNSEPLSLWRRVLSSPLRLFPRVYLFVCGFYSVTIKGKPASARDVRIVIAAPHSTAFDGVVLNRVLGLTSPVAKKEILSIPLVGPSAKLVQAILVDRTSKDGKAESLAEIKRRAISKKNFNRILLFPEGTCTNRKTLIQFKRGAFVPGTPVQPIALEWPWVHFNLAWTSGSNRKLGLIRALMQFRNSVVVHVLPAHYPTAEELEDPTLFANNVRAEISETLNVATSEHSYEDGFLSKTSRKCGVNIASAFPYEFKNLNDHVFDGKLTLKTTQSSLKRFSMAVRSPEEERIGLKQFAGMLGVPESNPVAKLFALLSQGDPNGISFAQFLAATACLDDEALANACSVVWKRADPTNAGELDIKTVTRTLADVFQTPDAAARMPFLKKARLGETGSLTYENFKKLMRDHGEYLLLAVMVTTEGAARPLSSTAAKLAANEA